MNDFNILLMTVGGLVLLSGAIAVVLRKTVISMLMIAMGVGVVLGFPGIDLLHPDAWGPKPLIYEEAARLTLAIGLMGIALRVPHTFILREWRTLALLLGPVMILMCATTTLLVWWLLPLGFWHAFLIGAMLTPTDPVLASSIVTGERATQILPEDLRHTLSTESGANDGLAYVLVMLPLLVLEHHQDVVGEWLGAVILWEVVAATAIGALFGYAAGRLLHWAEARHNVEHTSYLAATTALAFMTLGIARLLGTDGILAVFVAGLFFDYVVTTSDNLEKTFVEETMNQFFLLPIFVLFGLTLPFRAWYDLGWSAPLLVAGVLCLRRLPALLLFRPWLHTIRDWPSALFVGWFGPVGIAALFYASLVLRKTGYETAWNVVTLIVFASVLVHGATALPLSGWYRRHCERNGGAPCNRPPRYKQANPDPNEAQEGDQQTI